MRSWSLVTLLLVCASCTVRLPRPGEISIAVKTTTRVEARVQVKTPEVIVPIEGAAVVEFFGIPLEGAGDVVFVLDCSGSMADLAQGRLAQIQGHSHGAPAVGADSAGPPAPGAPPSDAVAPGVPPPPIAPPPGEPPPGAPPPGLPGEPAPGEPAPAAPVIQQLRKIDVAQLELVDALVRLPAGTRMNVLFFNNELEAFAPNMVPLDETARGGLIGFVKETAPTGSTALAPAMRTAFLMNARRIVLLSDGLGNVGGNADAVLRDAREAIRGGVRIDTIGIGAGQHRALLGALASESGGLYQAL